MSRRIWRASSNWPADSMRLRIMKLTARRVSITLRPDAAVQVFLARDRGQHLAGQRVGHFADSTSLLTFSSSS
jgi:hypothetical protein